MSKLFLTIFLRVSFIPVLFALEPAHSITLTFKDKAGQSIPDVVVYSTLSASTEAKPSLTVIDQKNKAFAPYVTAVTPGSQISFPNSDNTRHHVYSFSDAKTFELKLYRTNESPPITFDKPGIARLGCNIHDNMKAYVVITDHAVYGISDSMGKVIFELPDEATSSEFLIWHPQLDKPEILKLPAENKSFELVTTLSLDWAKPQQAKNSSELESRLKQFKRKSH